jgi:UDP-N-acetylglucosamine:LPS N-acetylglucosamine transferase
MKNCDYLENNNAAIVINQKNFTQEYLTSVFKTLIDNKNLIKSLSKNIKIK